MDPPIEPGPAGPGARVPAASGCPTRGRESGRCRFAAAAGIRLGSGRPWLSPPERVSAAVAGEGPGGGSQGEMARTLVAPAMVKVSPLGGSASFRVRRVGASHEAGPVGSGYPPLRGVVLHVTPDRFGHREQVPAGRKGPRPVGPSYGAGSGRCGQGPTKRNAAP